MEKKMRNRKKRRKHIKKSLIAPKKSKIIFEADKNEEIFNLKDNQHDNVDKEALFKEKENNLEKKEDEKEKNDDEKNDAMSTGSNSIEASEFNDIPQSAPGPLNNEDEPNNIVIRNISTNHYPYNNNQENLNIFHEEEQHNYEDEERHNDFFAFINGHDATQSGTNQDQE